MSETYKKEIVQHIIRNLLDIQLLRIVQGQPTWGYRIKKQVEAEFDIKLRHGALYPALNALEARGFLESRKQRESGRFRKVYAVTENGKAYLQAYYSVLRAQVKDEDGRRTD
jgi:PadR family transcriptional regulator PadR